MELIITTLRRRIRTLMEMDFMDLQGRFRYSIVVTLLVGLISCQSTEIPQLTSVDASHTKYIQKKGMMFLEDTLYSGKLYHLYSATQDTQFVRFFNNGQKNGLWKKFHENGVLMESRIFSQGKKEGSYLGWWPSGRKKFVYHFENDEYHGSFQEWNESGMMICHMNYMHGHEQGSQKVWYDNGKVKSNYSVKNGRRYGLLGTKNCVNTSDSVFVD